MEKYQIRNVAEREIYDSYMGIMRISPNPVSDSNDKLMDDPTNHLNSILSVDALTRTQKQMEIILSDSDGNKLPITFLPKAKKTTVLVCEGESKYLDSKPIINIVTKISDDARLFVTDNFCSHSTIYLNNNEENDAIYEVLNGTNEIGHKISSLQVITSDGFNENIVLYPVESPNDEGYFNDKNKLDLVDYSLSKKPKEQLEENLLKRSREWYDIHIPQHEENGVNKSERVKVAEKYVTTFNENGEVIPVLYTRDYTLGHYEGHTVDISPENSSKIKNNWIGSKSQSYDRTDMKSLTKLSWMRIDDLVWNVVDNVLRGEVRHTKGRYKKLGEGETDQIMDALFNGGKCSLVEETGGDDWLLKTAPLLGHGVQRGLILHNAIPFRKYYFHLMRQICTNMNYQFNKNANWYVESRENDDWSDFNLIASELMSGCRDNDIITPAPQGAVSPIHSLVKDFLLCDGKEIKYKNYPNMNLSNSSLFPDSNGFLTPVLDENGRRTFKEIDVENDNTICGAIYNSNETTYIFETPHLYSLIDESPRFIRGLNWTFNDENVMEKVVDFTQPENYVGDVLINSNKKFININGEDLKYDEEGNVEYDERHFGFNTSNVIKDISKVGLYFHNYDNLVKRDDHYHPAFSEEDGLNSINDDGEHPEEVDYLDECVGYKSGKKRGANVYSSEHGRVLNHDMTHNVPNDNTKEWIDYCFNKEILNKYNGYAPIPNGGLYLFNRALFNQSDKDYAGTSKYIENEIFKGNYVYYDGMGTPHNILPMTSKENMMKEFKIKVYKNIFNFNPKPSEDAPNKEDEEYWNNIEEAVADITLEEIYDASNGDAKIIEELCKTFRNVFEKHVKEKNIRRLQLTKMNESEGRIPACASGGPVYSAWVCWSRTEQRNLKKRRRKEYNFRWKGVGNYSIGINSDMKDEEFENLYSYRCLTSVPYQNSSLLGVGEVGEDIQNDWYNTNSVTSSKKERKYTEVSYGYVKMEEKDMDRNAPCPEYVNLLPFIRI